LAEQKCKEEIDLDNNSSSKKADQFPNPTIHIITHTLTNSYNSMIKFRYKGTKEEKKTTKKSIAE